MTARRKLREHMNRLTEIRDIMDAMKNLALLETHKLGSLLQTQQVLINDLETVAGDFLDFFPWPEQAPSETDCWIVFGSERGFCGDFNEALLDELEVRLAASGSRHLLLAVGAKLQLKLAQDPRVAAFLEGPDVAEEIIPVLNKLVVQLGELQAAHIYVLFHEAQTDQVALHRLMPPFEKAEQGAAHFAFPPIVNVAPATFFSRLLDRYLFVALQEIACTSLMAENQKRIQHMTGAVRRLDETTQLLMRQYHMRRQEDITEEIEVILLNAGREFE